MQLCGVLKELILIMLRIFNVILLGFLIYSAFQLVGIRYKSRQDYSKLALLKKQTSDMNDEYTKLLLEEGTFSSKMVLSDYAITKLGFIQADKSHIIEVR